MRGKRRGERSDKRDKRGRGREYTSRVHRVEDGQEAEDKRAQSQNLS